MSLCIDRGHVVNFIIHNLNGEIKTIIQIDNVLEKVTATIKALVYFSYYFYILLKNFEQFVHNATYLGRLNGNLLFIKLRSFSLALSLWNILEINAEFLCSNTTVV